MIKLEKSKDLCKFVAQPKCLEAQTRIRGLYRWPKDDVSGDHGWFQVGLFVDAGEKGQLDANIFLKGGVGDKFYGVNLLSTIEGAPSESEFLSIVTALDEHWVSSIDKSEIDEDYWQELKDSIMASEEASGFESVSLFLEDFGIDCEIEDAAVVQQL